MKHWRVRLGRVIARKGTAGPGLANLHRVAAKHGADLEDSYLLEGLAREARLRIGKHRFVWASNGSHLYLSIPTPKVAVMLNLGRPGWGLDEPIVRRFGAVPMYLNEPRDDGYRPFIEATRRWIAEPANIELVEELDLEPGEWASFGANWSVAQLRAREGDEDLRRVELVLRIVDAATDPSAAWLGAPRLDPASIPERFRDLLPFVHKWAIDDDAIRSDRMERARTQSLLALWAAVGPRLAEIDQFLDGEGDDATYEALKIGRLAEATVEAGIELKARGIEPNTG